MGEFVGQIITSCCNAMLQDRSSKCVYLRPYGLSYPLRLSLATTTATTIDSMIHLTSPRLLQLTLLDVDDRKSDTWYQICEIAKKKKESHER